MNNEGINNGFDVTQLYDGLQDEFDNYNDWFQEKNPGGYWTDIQ